MTDGVAARFDSVAYPAADERALQAMLLHPGSATLARPGRRPGPGLEATIGGTPEAVTIAAGGGVITDSAGGGSYIFETPGKSITLPARPSAGTSRIDYVVAQIKNEDARPGDLLREVQIVHVPGTAGASPVAPTLTSGQLRLARLDVPASGTIAVSKPAQRMAAAGGTIIVADSTERDAISPLYNGIEVYREDNNTVERRVGGAWRVAYAAGDVFTGNEGAVLGSAPPAGTRKIMKQSSVGITLGAGAPGFVFSYHDGAFPNGIVSLGVWPGDSDVSGLTIVPHLASCTLGVFNGNAYNGAGTGLASGVVFRVNYMAIGW